MMCFFYSYVGLPIMNSLDYELATNFENGLFANQARRFLVSSWAVEDASLPSSEGRLCWLSLISSIVFKFSFIVFKNFSSSFQNFPIGLWFDFQHTLLQTKTVFMSSIPHNLLNTPVGKAFVYMYATCCSVQRYSSLTVFYFTWSLSKWYLTSICLLLPCCTGFLASSMTDLLSIYIIVDSFWPWSNSFKMFLNHVASQIGDDAAIYSASHVDNATLFCFLELHVKVVDPI